MIPWWLRLAIVTLLFALTLAPEAVPQTEPGLEDVKPIARDQTDAMDAATQVRIAEIFEEIKPLSRVEVTVNNGVVTLRGEAANDSAAERALDLSGRVEGVIAVEDQIERSLSVEDNLSPILSQLADTVDTITKAWPLYVIALCAFLAISFAAHLVASVGPFWRFVAPNPFVARILAQAIRAAGITAGILVALSLLDAMALFGAVAGGAGLLGLAVGFAVRDTIENYIASIMLSLRQPFRPEDHVVINDLEGVIIRLTSRATILMTLDGNHLRVPNADVFKGTILNYTRNPKRRFSFELGIDANDNPLEASEFGLTVLRELGFVLSDPEPSAIIVKVGDSNIVIDFKAWVDQRETDFAKARGVGISAVKTVLEDQGFTLPEPIYRIRIDEAGTLSSALRTSKPSIPVREAPVETARPTRKQSSPEITDVAPDKDVRDQVAADRSDPDQEDLLSEDRPIE